jgi:hypothetical protein
MVPRSPAVSEQETSTTHLGEYRRCPAASNKQLPIDPAWAQQTHLGQGPTTREALVRRLTSRQAPVSHDAVGADHGQRYPTGPTTGPRPDTAATPTQAVRGMTAARLAGGNPGGPAPHTRENVRPADDRALLVSSCWSAAIQKILSG